MDFSSKEPAMTQAETHFWIKKSENSMSLHLLYFFFLFRTTKLDRASTTVLVIRQVSVRVFSRQQVNQRTSF